MNQNTILEYHNHRTLGINGYGCLDNVVLQNANSEHNSVLVIEKVTLLTITINDNRIKKSIQYKYGNTHTHTHTHREKKHLEILGYCS